MMTLLLAAFLLWQEQSDQARVGVLTGILRDASGKVQANVRVAAMAVDESSDTEVLVSIGRTNESGEYRLEVPSGQYYVVAGRVDRPTYYPGVSDMPKATRVAISPRSSHELNFIVSAASLDAPTQSREDYAATLRVPRLPFRSAPSPLTLFLRAYSDVNGPSKFIFELARVIGQTVSFYRETASMGSFSYGCTNCPFFVMERAAGPQRAEPGILFKLSADGQTLTFTCYATACNVARATPTGFTVSAMKNNESGSASISDQVAFGVRP